MTQRGHVRQRGEGGKWQACWFVLCPGDIEHPGKGGAPWRCAEPHRQMRVKGGFPRRRDALAHLNTVLGQVQDGTYAEPTDKKITVKAYLTDVWLPAVRTGSTKSGEPRRAATIASYEIAVDKWIVPHIGGERLVGLTPRHVESMLSELAAHGGKKGRPLGGRSVQYAHTVVKMALDMAVKRGYVQRNVAAVVERPGAEHREMACWTAGEAQAFLSAAAEDRLYAAWVLFLARGPRRGELAGLRWDDVDLDAHRLRIVHTRISVGGRVEESEPKTRAGRRTIPLDDGLVAVLRAHRKRQLEDRLAWGEAWIDSGYVFTREDGLPWHPEHFSDRFDRLVKAGGVRRIRMHDTRHTAATLMLEDGTPVKVAQELLGHSSSAITQELYQHVLPGMAEAAGERLSGRLLGGQA